MNIYYGTLDIQIDVTEICMNELKKENLITIPFNDSVRARYFTDPVVGTLKYVFVKIDDKVSGYAADAKVMIDCNTKQITHELDDLNKLLQIHSTLTLNYGSLYDEFPEQRMAVNYLKGHEKVLEIGGNIGRNSCVIRRILNHSDFVSLECDPLIATQLIENRDVNGLDFHVENAALSKRKLIQKGWDTIPSDTLLDGYTWINTITWDELNKKYNILFDTLVLDCEGAFYYILIDMPEILDHINLILMENDYHNYVHKLELDRTLRSKGFKVDYSEEGGWGPCSSHFFEVWKR